MRNRRAVRGCSRCHQTAVTRHRAKTVLSLTARVLGHRRSGEARPQADDQEREGVTCGNEKDGAPAHRYHPNTWATPMSTAGTGPVAEERGGSARVIPCRRIRVTELDPQ